MKKMTIILIFLISITQLISHEQKDAPVHQRIIYEAYRLLKLQLSKENGFADMDNYIGTIGYHNVYYWYKIKTLTGGSSHEDDEDIVFKHWGVRKYGIAGSWSHTSITHFLEADKPHDGMVKLIGSSKFESAYKKACAYMWDSYIKEFKLPFEGGEFFGYQYLACPRKDNSYLFQWYWKDKIWVKKSFNYNRFWTDTDKKSNYYWNWGNQKSKELFFNILGRLSHLLTDMGVPEHAKRSIHPTKHEAPFEQWTSDSYNSEFSWPAERVYHERGGFINPFCEIGSDQNLFLFYTTSQLSDIFSAFGRIPSSGDTDFDRNIGEIESIKKSYFPPEYTGSNFKYYSKPPTSWGFAWKDLSNELGRPYRDALLPYTIRAVAGLLYKFIIESKMQNYLDGSLVDAAGTIYDQQQELNLFKQDINGDYYTFRAEGTPGTITVCPEVVPEVDKYFIIGPDTRNVTFRAAKEVVFKPGFTATHGSQVHVYTCADCNRFEQPGNCHQCLQEDYNPQYDRSR